MNKTLIACLLTVMASTSQAAEKIDYSRIDIGALMTEIQGVFSGAPADHVAMATWFPIEFWKSIYAHDPFVSSTDKASTLWALRGVSLLAVGQVDVSRIGEFLPYPRHELMSKMAISFTDEYGNVQTLKPLTEIRPDLQGILKSIRKTFASSMGDIAGGMHFFVLDNTSASTARLMNPYRKGRLQVRLANRNGERMTANIAMPLNAFFKPRKCPNGENAHITWKFCPWSGARLSSS